MSTSNSYPTQEWTLLARAPEYVGSYIIMADLGVTTIVKELKGLAKAIEETEAPEAARSLVTEIVEQFKRQEASLDEAQRKAEQEAADGALGPDHQAGIREMLTRAMDAVRARGGDAEAGGFGAWLMVLAQATAEAAKEGGVLGIGASRVSDKEKAALAELAAILGTPAA